MLNSETTQLGTLDLWKPMGTRHRIPTSPLYTPGHPRLNQKTPDKSSNDWEAILQQCPMLQAQASSNGRVKKMLHIFTMAEHAAMLETALLPCMQPSTLQ